MRVERVVLFDKESHKKNLFTWLDLNRLHRDGEPTSVITGHRMPERSKSRAEPGVIIVVSDLRIAFVEDGRGGWIEAVRQEKGMDGLTTPCLAMVQLLQTP